MTRVIEGFLPPPSQLVFKEDTKAVDIMFTRCSVEFFKAEAKKRGTNYRHMIRVMLDWYAQQNALLEVGKVRRRRQ